MFTPSRAFFLRHDPFMKNSYLLILFLALLSLHKNILPQEATLVYVPPKPRIVIDFEADQLHKQKALREYAKQRGIETLEEEDEALYEEAFEQAPDELKALIKDILQGDPYTKAYKAILLTGPSGAGKSTLARAIVYKLQRKCRIIHAPALLGHYRDQATENVRDMFKEWRTDKEKHVLIIEEINALTDGHTSEHGDTKHTAMQLWTSLDSFKHEDDFLLIGTTNITNKMPHQLQSRFKGKTFFIDNPSEEARKRAIIFFINNLDVACDATCTDTYLAELAKKIEKFSERDIQTLITTAILLFSRDNCNAPVKLLTKKHLELAYTKLIQEDKTLWNFTEPITDEERRHQENIDANVKLAILSLMTREGTFESNVETWLKTLFPKRKLDWKWKGKFFNSERVSNDE